MNALMGLIGKRVKVTNNTGMSWSGTLTALCDHPSMIVDHADGTRYVLPQHLTVSEDTEPETHGMAWLHHCGHLNPGAWNNRSVCAGCRFSVEHADEVDAHYVLTVVPAPPQQHHTTYRGTLPAQEAPPTAVLSHCPVGLCDWKQYWDAAEELNEAKLRHVRDDHGEADPEIAILRAQLRSEAARYRNR